MDFRPDEIDTPEERPWEQPGAFRLDCEPHRGPLLSWLGEVSVALGCLCTAPCLFGIPGLIGLPLGLTTLMLARRDLARMNQGLVDPSGKGLTRRALRSGIWGLVLSTVLMLVWGTVFTLLLLTDQQR